jgi:vanillate O-demethylase monooxygenase subunit
VTHYFFAMGRNVMIDDPEQTRLMAEFARRAFEEEDEPMIKACQSLMGTADLFSLRPAILKSDVAAIQARRAIAKLMSLADADAPRRAAE